MERINMNIAGTNSAQGRRRPPIFRGHAKKRGLFSIYYLLIFGNLLKCKDKRMASHP